jgi:putative ABC transport system permease protein
VSLWRIAWIYLWNRWLTTGLTILSVAMAVGLISAILTVRNETRARFEEEQQAYDVVVGAGSPLQLVLNAVYFLDNPTGAIPYSDYEKIKARIERGEEDEQEKDVVYAFPVGMGDTYKRFSIVGTEKEMFAFPWENPNTGKKRYPFQLAEGRFFDAPMEAVVGFQVARATGLKLGDVFASTHGNFEVSSDMAEYDHSKEKYKVVGLLKASGTSNDRAIFVDLQSVWDLHKDHAETAKMKAAAAASPTGSPPEHHDDRRVTAVLVSLYSPAQRFTFLDTVINEYKLTGAIPVVQILRLYDQILGPAVIIMIAVGYVVVVISALSILIGLYLSIIQRRRDLAIMRALGASAYEIFGAVMIEALLVTLMGIASGWVLGKGVAFGLGQYMARAYGFAMAGLGTSREEIGFFAVVAVVGLLAGILPAWQAYQTDVARDLQAN